MKQLVIAGTLVSALAMSGIALASQAQTPTGQTPAAQATSPKHTVKHRANTDAATQSTEGAHTAPKDQPATAPDATVSDTSIPLGTVHLPKETKADGKPLPAGTYQVHLTTDAANPAATGADQSLERWVEFRKAGKVVGREVVSIVPKDETKMVQKDTPPGPGQSKVQALKGGDYVRVWINKGGNYYLVYLVA
ncbi:MAG: hypothetical protein ACRD1V_05215 [Vicinamibacterales bacterium]